MSIISAIQSYRSLTIASTRGCCAISTKTSFRKARRASRASLCKRRAHPWSPMKSQSLGVKLRISLSLSRFLTWMSTWIVNSSTRCSQFTSLVRMTESDMSIFFSARLTLTGRLQAKFLTFYSTKWAERTKSLSSALTSNDEQIQRSITSWPISALRSTSTLSMRVIGISRIDASWSVIRKTVAPSGSWSSPPNSCQESKRSGKHSTTCTTIPRVGSHQPPNENNQDVYDL